MKKIPLSKKLAGCAVIIVILFLVLVFLSISFTPRVDPPMSHNNLRTIAIATATSMTIRGRVPQGGTILEDGRAGHGWIMPLLPNLEQIRLYEQIDKTKPWNDPVNQESYSTRLPILAWFPHGVADEEKTDPHGYPVTTYSANKHVFLVGEYLPVADITDGQANTIFFGEIRKNYPAWGSPHNMRDPGLGLAPSSLGFGGNRTTEITLFAFGDGGVHSIANTVDPEILKALATPNGGEKINHSLY